MAENWMDYGAPPVAREPVGPLAACGILCALGGTFTMFTVAMVPMFPFTQMSPMASYLNMAAYGAALACTMWYTGVKSIWGGLLGLVSLAAYLLQDFHKYWAYEGEVLPYFRVSLARNMAMLCIILIFVAALICKHTLVAVRRSGGKLVFLWGLPVFVVLYLVRNMQQSMLLLESDRGEWVVMYFLMNAYGIVVLCLSGLLFWFLLDCPRPRMWLGTGAKVWCGICLGASTLFFLVYLLQVDLYPMLDMLVLLSGLAAYILLLTGRKWGYWLLLYALIAQTVFNIGYNSMYVELGVSVFAGLLNFINPLITGLIIRPSWKRSSLEPPKSLEPYPAPGSMYR